MKLRKKITALVLAAVVSASVAGCGFVTVVPKGQEALFTGVQEVDISAAAADDWTLITEEVSAAAAGLAETLEEQESSKTYAVKFTGTVKEHNTDTPKGYLAVEVDGIDADVQVSTGSVISGTAVRDAQTLKTFQDFENQTEWSDYGSKLNAQVISNVIDAGGIGDDTVGRTIEVTGCYKPASNGTITVVPVAITVQ